MEDDDESDASFETVISPEHTRMSEEGDEGVLASVLTKLTEMMEAHGETHRQLVVQQGYFEWMLMAVFSSHSDQLTTKAGGAVEFQ